MVVSTAAGRPLAPGCRRLLGRLLRRMRHRGWGVTLLLCSDAVVRRLNRRHLGRDRATDVLSFPSGGDLEPGRRHLGDIAIALPRASRQARRARWTLREEVALLVTHGLLHLLGYDHETDDGTMRQQEERLLWREAGIILGRRGVPWGAGSRRPRRTPRAAQRGGRA